MVRFCTYNARGLGDFKKRKQLFNLFKLKQLDFVLVQETHATDRDVTLWRSQWGGNIIFANGVSDARGVMILIHREIHYEIGRIVIDPTGRYLMTEITIDNFTFVICNPYAPNTDSPEFFKNVETELECFDNGNIMVAGDFNFAINPILDRKYSTHNNDNARDTFMAYADFKELVDIWRTLHPDSKQFSCCRSNRNPNEWNKFSRLDMFFVSQGIMNCMKSCSMQTGFQSDHSFVICDAQFSNGKTGPGYWKFNNSFLHDKSFVTAANAIIEESIVKHNMEADVKWEFIKGAFIDFSKKYGRDKAKAKKEELLHIENSLHKLKIFIEELPVPAPDAFKEYCALQDKRKSIIQQKVDGIIIRSREKFFAEGERSSKYYFSLEKHNAQKKTMFRVRDQNNMITSNQSKIHEAQVRYFRKLYTPEKIAKFDLVNKSSNKLTAEQKASLDAPLSIQEFGEAVLQMPNNKSPGLDGLTIEVYKVFWGKFKEAYFSAVQTAKTKGILLKAMRQGVITLIPKREKDLLSISNWRPIVMLTCDYKILAKVLALRMQKVLPDIIHSDQTGFMKGRNIADNIRKTIEVVNHAHKKRIEFLVMTIDYQKCFDYLQHSALWKCLEYFNFGESYVNWIRLLYNKIFLKTCNYGFLSDPIEVNRSVLQGSPLAAFLFLNAGQILHDLVKENKNIRGLTLDEIELLIAQFADDTTLFIEYSREVIEVVTDTLNVMSQNTGLVINYDKTNIYRIGSLANTDAKIYTTRKFNWTNDPIELLGVIIPTVPDVSLLAQLNFENTLNKSQSVIKLWSLRAPTLSGRILLVNALIMSLFVYKWQVLPNMTDLYVNKLIANIKAFIWNNKRPKIAYNILIQDRANGGLRLSDVLARQKSLKIQWMTRIEDNILWQKCFYKSLQVNIGNVVWQCNLTALHVKSIFVADSDVFWIDVLKAWADYNFVFHLDYQQFGEQIIWYNSLFLLDNKPFIFKKAFDNGVLRVKDLYSSEGHFMEFQQFVSKFGNCIGWYQFCQLITVLTRYQFKIINVHNQVLPKYQQLCKSGKISNIVYDYLIQDKNLLSGRLGRWTRKFHCNITIDQLFKVFNNITKITIATKLRNFQYQLLLGVTVTNRLLKLWGLVDSDLCTFCQREVEDDLHLFVLCDKIKFIWEGLKEYIRHNDKAGIFPVTNWSPMNIIFSTVISKPANVINLLVTITKQYIYRCRCLKIPLSQNTLINEIEQVYKCELNLAIRKSRLRLHAIKWSCLKDLPLNDDNFVVQEL